MAEVFIRYHEYNKAHELNKLQELMTHVINKPKSELERTYDKYGYTILTLACRDARSVKVVDFLLRDCRLNPDIKDRNNNAGIHYASSQGLSDIIGLLVYFKSDINITDENEDTPLILAVKNDKFSAAIVLLSSGADRSIGYRKLLDTATAKGNTHMISILEGNQSDAHTYENFRKVYQQLNTVQTNLNRMSPKLKPKQFSKVLEDTREALDSGKGTELVEIHRKLDSMNEQITKVEEKGEKTLTRVHTMEKKVDSIEVVVKKLNLSHEDLTRNIIMLSNISNGVFQQNGALTEIIKENTSVLKKNLDVRPYDGNRYDTTGKVYPKQKNKEETGQEYAYIPEVTNLAKTVQFYVEGQEVTEEFDCEHNPRETQLDKTNPNKLELVKESAFVGHVYEPVDAQSDSSKDENFTEYDDCIYQTNDEFSYQDVEPELNNDICYKEMDQHTVNEVPNYKQETVRHEVPSQTVRNKFPIPKPRSEVLKQPSTEASIDVKQKLPKPKPRHESLSKTPSYEVQNQAPVSYEAQNQAPISYEAQNQAPVSYEAQNQAPVSYEAQNQALIITYEAQQLPPVTDEPQSQAHVRYGAPYQAPVRYGAPYQPPASYEVQNQAVAKYEAQNQALVGYDTQNQAPVRYEAHKQAPVRYEVQNQALSRYEAPKQTADSYDTQNQAPVGYDTQNQSPVRYEAQNQAHVRYEAQNQAHVRYEAQNQAPVRYEAPNKTAYSYAAINQAHVRHDAPNQTAISCKAHNQAPGRYGALNQTSVRHEAEDQATISCDTHKQAPVTHETNIQAATEIIPEKSKEFLRHNLVHISRNVCLQRIYPTLYVEGFIMDHQLRQIQNGCDEEKMIFEIFESLQRSSSSSLMRMKDVLRREKQSHIADLLPDC